MPVPIQGCCSNWCQAISYIASRTPTLLSQLPLVTTLCNSTMASVNRLDMEGNNSQATKVNRANTTAVIKPPCKDRYLCNNKITGIVNKTIWAFLEMLKPPTTMANTIALASQNNGWLLDWSLVFIHMAVHTPDDNASMIMLLELWLPLTASRWCQMAHSGNGWTECVSTTMHVNTPPHINPLNAYVRSEDVAIRPMRSIKATLAMWNKRVLVSVNQPE